ncbi:YlmC/YmxH family sporulation protein [Allobacillus sp. GCM10007491]|uniref:YlmC/YmxH family sporulation protein n=2 Tax=Allobacillus TaxID=1400133 RepID=A0A941HRP0_9BACI|nr:MULTISPECIES: YlmC/YmxH family sporulation protein [Allobacillus]MBR7552806.1 YlmC/YmxH family sporulation protein [Allobacillus saliphilus]TSJ67073.1 YlmC/YmxH family sporulation protein [Allobacillus salarius]
MLLSELQSKDIINIDSGEKVGFVGDIEIDVTVGVVTYLIVTISQKWFGLLGNEEELKIPWTNIVKIGTDVILVRLN